MALSNSPGVEVAKKGKEGSRATKSPRAVPLLWIPEEAHRGQQRYFAVDGREMVSTLRLDTEVVKDKLLCQKQRLFDVVEVTQKNDISAGDFDQPWRTFTWWMLRMMSWIGMTPSVNAGEEVMPGLVGEDLRYVNYIDTPEGPACCCAGGGNILSPDETGVPSQDSVSDA